MANNLKIAIIQFRKNIPVNWQCPYCRRDTTITTNDYSFAYTDKGSIRVYTSIVCCPNMRCKKSTIFNSKYDIEFVNGKGMQTTGNPISCVQIEPSYSANEIPDYVPESIRNDYLEACKIIELSPKASATLSRRCIQGMIRDFWKISKKTLNEEINELRGKIDNSLWSGIDALRKIGNIGAHMERDINTIVEVDSEESQLLVNMIETLIKEWYINRNDRENNIKRLIQVSSEMQKQKNA